MFPPSNAPKIPLVLLDLDGTIIGLDGDVSDNIWQAVHTARAAGVIIATCTGRPCQGAAQKIALRLGSTTPHIFHNGALIANANGQILQAHTLAPEVLIKLALHARSIGATIEFYTTSETFVDHATERCIHHAEVLDITVIERDLLEVAHTLPVLRAHWILAPTQLDAALACQPSGTQIGTATSPALPESIFASVTSEGISKGSAAREIAQILNYRLADVMAIGDSGSDIPALEIVGHPRVIGGSPTELTTKYPVLPTIEEDGVVSALQEASQQKRLIY